MLEFVGEGQVLNPVPMAGPEAAGDDEWLHGT